MLMPSIFDDEMDLFDDWMEFPAEKEWKKALFGKRNPLYGKNEANLMKTDVRESDNEYEIDIDLPGFAKDDIKVSLENGYLTIAAQKNQDKESEDQNHKFIRKERYSGSCARSYYLGDSYRKEDLKAKYNSGILKLYLPKKEAAQVESDHYIAIEG